jgi:hypothetical protein
MQPPDVQSRVSLHMEDLRQFGSDESFGLVTMPFRRLQHLAPVEGHISCLRAHTHLRIGGMLVFDVFNLYWEALVADNVGQEIGPDCEFTMEDGRRVARYSKLVTKDHFSQVNDMELIYSRQVGGGLSMQDREVYDLPMSGPLRL